MVFFYLFLQVEKEPSYHEQTVIVIAFTLLY